MTKIRAIAAVDYKWAAGNEGCLLFNNSSDLKRFSELTRNHTVVMGRKTLQSLPLSCSLPDRENIILSKNPSWYCDNCKIINSIDDLKNHIHGTNDDLVWIIGGEQIWNQTIDLVNECYITYHYAKAPSSDVYFPNLDKLDNWRLISTDGPYKTQDNIDFEYRIYKNTK